MILKVLGSSSLGNCYFLQNNNEVLLLECGVSIKDIKQELNDQFSKVVGCLVTHVHKDHSKSINKLLASGIDVYASETTFEVQKHHRAKILENGDRFKVGNFDVVVFEVNHDCEGAYGYLIHHPDIGKLLFVTDTCSIDYKFNQLNHVLVECNFSDEIIEQNVLNGSILPVVRNRIIKSHFSLDNCSKFVEQNCFGSKNVVLLHLSDGNSNAEEFKSVMGTKACGDVYIADKGLKIELNEQYF